MSSTAAPRTGDRPGIVAAAPLLVVSVVANLSLLAIATLLDAARTVVNAGTQMSVGVVEVAVASVVPLGLAIAAYAMLAPRIVALRRAWAPAVVVLTVLSLGAVLGATDLTTGLVLGTMHLVVGGLAAFGIPARLGR
ncbi:DUF6069 family protein [Salsipaludibacter albus]|uniref:DUF6069 family protein n=1 Tax=Salsipaludibacter albus TaxID=2849650 RepID=UPI001EE484A3|nr:DUF6069 family protein [Salsipaludibacter albus]MBY5161008.1 hypothetical protein [Salsipaludibacter albus]